MSLLRLSVRRRRSSPTPTHRHLDQHLSRIRTNRRMELKCRATACGLLILLLVLSPHYDGVDGGGMLAAEARVCTGKSQRHSFRPCISDRNCADDCIKEHGAGWTAGYCRRATCTCQKAC